MQYMAVNTSSEWGSPASCPASTATCNQPEAPSRRIVPHLFAAEDLSSDPSLPATAARGLLTVGPSLRPDDNDRQVR